MPDGSSRRAKLRQGQGKTASHADVKSLPSLHAAARTCTEPRLLPLLIPFPGCAQAKGRRLGWCPQAHRPAEHQTQHQEGAGLSQVLTSPYSQQRGCHRQLYLAPHSLPTALGSPNFKLLKWTWTGRGVKA